MWYEWDTKEEFDAWHSNLCNVLGYPLTPVNQLSGLPDEDAQKVVKYTEPIEVNGKWIAIVEEEYAINLTATELRRPVRILE
jgi:myosin-crossreactive antigen